MSRKIRTLSDIQASKEQLKTHFSSSESESESESDEELNLSSFNAKRIHADDEKQIKQLSKRFVPKTKNKKSRSPFIDDGAW
jgi:hypothetical protein